MSAEERAALDSDPAYDAWLQARFAEFLADLEAEPAYRVAVKSAEVRQRFTAAREQAEAERSA